MDIDVKALLKENDAILRKAKTEIRKKRELCVDCKTKLALYEKSRCEDCLPVHEQKVKEDRAGRVLQRENKPTLIYDESGKLVYEHRVIMEKILGRPLSKDEVVTWRNGVKNDNRPENLILALRAGVPLDDLVCPHCNIPYRSDIAELVKEMASIGDLIENAPEGKIYFMNKNYLIHEPLAEFKFPSEGA